jgi:hypothetical protein
MSENHWKWQETYLEAFLDTDPLNLANRVAAAEKAIYLRTEELRASTGAGAEWRAIADAMSGLSILKGEINRPAEIRPERRPEELRHEIPNSRARAS